MRIGAMGNCNNSYGVVIIMSVLAKLLAACISYWFILGCCHCLNRCEAGIIPGIHAGRPTHDNNSTQIGIVNVPMERGQIGTVVATCSPLLRSLTATPRVRIRLGMGPSRLVRDEAPSGLHRYQVVPNARRQRDRGRRSTACVTALAGSSDHQQGQRCPC